MCAKNVQKIMVIWLVVVLCVVLLLFSSSGSLLRNTWHANSGDTRHFDQPPSVRNYDPKLPCIRAPQTCQTNQTVIPNVVHYIWFYNTTRDIDFNQLISFLSVVRIQRPNILWFWYGKAYPSGYYWNEFLKETSKSSTRFKAQHIEEPTHIHDIKVRQVEHAADITRLQILLQYGGIYLDSDVVIVQNLKPLMCYTYVAGLEFDNKLNNGFLMTNSSSEFLKIFNDSYRDYQPDKWVYNSVENHYSLYRKHPNLLHVEPHCINRPNCHHADFVYGRKGLYFDWSNHYAVHFFNKEEEDFNVTNIITKNSTAAEVYYYIYYGERKPSVNR